MAIGKLVQEDPTLRVNTDPDTGQTILAGMGELHLEIIVDRMQREFGVGANVGKPQVAYRETIRKGAEAEGRFVRQTGGHGQYGHVKLRIEPAPGAGFEFVNDIKGGTIPKEYIGPVEQGIAEALEGGVLAGLPDGGREGDAVRRQLPRRGLFGNGVQDRRFDGGEGRGREGQAGSARAGHERRSGGSGRVHGRRDRRSEFAPRPHRGIGIARHLADHQGDGAAVGNVRLRDRHCGRARRAAAASRCTSGATRKCPATIAEEIISRVQGKVSR